MNDSPYLIWMIVIVVLGIYFWLIMLFILKKTGRKVYFFIANPMDYAAFIRIIIREKSVINKVKYLLLLLFQIFLFVLFVWLIKSRFLE